MLRRWIYNFSLVVLLIGYLPVYLWGRFAYKKYRRSFFYRLGLKKAKLPPLNSPVIWIHAISLGEAKVALPFAIEAKKSYPEASIIVSSVTETGFDEVQKTMPFIAGQLFLPFDFSWLIRPLVAKIKPKLMVFVEGDLWLNLLEATQNIGAKVLVINGKISQKSFQRHLFFPGYTTHLFSLIDHLCLQNSLYQRRFCELGVSQEKLCVTGNVKLDIPRPHLEKQQLQTLREMLAISPKDQVITIGSTHPKEEELLLRALLPLKCKILLAPRHPERFGQVEGILRGMCSYGTWSHRHLLKGDEEVILINTLGELMHCYQLSVVAVVGGSFVDIGGHNLLEPLEYGVPSLFGPYVYKQKEFAAMALEEGIGFQVDAFSLAEKTKEILDSLELQKMIAKRAAVFLASSRGASSKSWSYAQKLLSSL